MKWRILFTLLLMTAACSSQVPSDTPPEQTNEEFPTSFKVKYWARYESSGGLRELNVSYDVQNREIVFCEGTYSYPPSMDQRTAGNWNQNIEECQVEKLKNGKYNVPLRLITEITTLDDMTGEGTSPPNGKYSWEVIDD